MWLFKPSEAHFLNPAQRAALAALFDAIVPPGDDNPGAGDVGAAEYLDRLLARDDSTYYELKAWRPQYVAGLAMLDAAAIAAYGGRNVAALKPQEVAALLGNLAAGKLSGFPDAAWQTAFFTVLRGHCIEGCFADQRWGGNQNNLMWQWYGYPTGPSVDFDRSRPGPANPPPAGADMPSGNTATAQQTR
jgi:hypothetical protein